MNGASGVMNAAELNKIIDEWDDADDKISEISDGDSDVETVLDYIFRTGETTEYDAIKDEEDLFDDEQKAAIKSFVDDTTASYRQKYYINFVGKMSKADEEAIQTAWAEAIKPATDDDTTTETAEDGLETWQIVLIVVSSVIVVAGIVGGVVYFVLESKKKKEKAQADKDTVNAYKKRIDTTDDKSIDVYADEETPAEETNEEATEEKVEETTEEVSEEPVETAETVEETSVETAEPVAKNSEEETPKEE